VDQKIGGKFPNEQTGLFPNRIAVWLTNNNQKVVFSAVRQVKKLPKNRS
jgi:hypothetical protein